MMVGMNEQHFIDLFWYRRSSDIKDEELEAVWDLLEKTYDYLPFDNIIEMIIFDIYRMSYDAAIKKYNATDEQDLRNKINNGEIFGVYFKDGVIILDRKTLEDRRYHV